MKDYQASLGKLRKDSAESKLIGDLATSNAKRKMFAKLAKRLEKLADEVERAMTVKRIDDDY
jgi:chaperonin cofactor prefoldin